MIHRKAGLPASSIVTAIEIAATPTGRLAHLNLQTWAHTTLLNVTVYGGIVDLWGLSRSDAEKKAIRVAAETTPGVQAVNDHLVTGMVPSWI